MIDDTNRYSDDELHAAFDELFPQGFAGTDVQAELFPQGYKASGLYQLLHPSAEVQYEEALRIHRNLGALRQGDAEPPPEPRREDYTDDEEPDTTSEQEQIARLVGCGLWDIFSDNHEVTDADGRELDLGSFRSGGGFIADHCNRQITQGLLEAGDLEARQMAMDQEFLKMMPGSGMELFFKMMKEQQTGPYRYTDFHMGSGMISGRGDLAPLYEMIFRRLKAKGYDWKYVFPRLNLVDLRPLKEAMDAKKGEEEGEPEWAGYDPGASFEQEQADAEKDREQAEMREKLDEGYRESVAAAQEQPPPTVVTAYEMVYGSLPEGWPPEAE